MDRGYMSRLLAAKMHSPTTSLSRWGPAWGEGLQPCGLLLSKTSSEEEEEAKSNREGSTTLWMGRTYPDGSQEPAKMPFRARVRLQRAGSHLSVGPLGGELSARLAPSFPVHSMRWDRSSS